MTGEQGFLADVMPRPWTPEARHGFRATGLFVGKGANAIEVAVARSGAARLVVPHPGGAGLCGASTEEPPVYPRVNDGQVERPCREVLDLIPMPPSECIGIGIRSTPFGQSAKDRSTMARSEASLWRIALGTPVLPDVKTTIAA